MLVYTLKIEFFDSLDWCDRNVKISALTKISLAKGFIKATEFCHENTYNGISYKEYRKKLWKYYFPYIKQEELKFPIITDL